MVVLHGVLPGEPVYNTAKSRKPKGYREYSPREDRKIKMRNDILAVIEDHRRNDLLPVGSRSIAYATLDRGWSKDDMDDIEGVLLRLRRCGDVAFSDISDGRSIHDRPTVVDDTEGLIEYLEETRDEVGLDLQTGQPRRVELWVEAAGMIDRVTRTAHGYGVPVSSGQGSVPAAATRALAIRAVSRYLNEKVPTVVLQIGDFDRKGYVSILEALTLDSLTFAAQHLALAPDEISVGDVLAVRRLALTLDQVEEYIPESKREYLRDPWRHHAGPVDFKVQAEALNISVLLEILTDALDTLLPDVDTRERLRREARTMREQVVIREEA